MKELATPYDAKVGKYYLLYATNRDVKTAFVVKVLQPHDGYNEFKHEYQIVGKYKDVKYKGIGHGIPRHSINVHSGICYTYWMNDVLYKLNEDEFNKHVLMEMI